MNDLTAPLTAMALLSGASVPATPAVPVRPTIVLVHGAFVDGSGWSGVHRILREKGFPVIVVQNPTTSLAEDVAATRLAIAAAAGEVILVGHSYGGVVITEAGSDPKVKALVYVAAFAPDQGESVSSLLANAPPDAEGPPILPPVSGFLLLDKAKFPAAFAADVAPALAGFMADSQVPWGVQAFDGRISRPAWKVKPSWFVVAQDDRMIPPQAQRAMAGRAGATVHSLPGSHAIYVANPPAIATYIEEAAEATRAGAAREQTMPPAS